MTIALLGKDVSWKELFRNDLVQQGIEPGKIKHYDLPYDAVEATLKCFFITKGTGLEDVVHAVFALAKDPGVVIIVDYGRYPDDTEMFASYCLLRARTLWQVQISYTDGFRWVASRYTFLTAPTSTH